jgi:hypothetical protein
MPRYVVQRTFAERLGLAATREGARRCLDLVETNTVHGVTWGHSYVTADGNQRMGAPAGRRHGPHIRCAQSGCIARVCARRSGLR